MQTITQEPFPIYFTRAVEFRDWRGSLVMRFEIDDTIDATADAGHYYVTTWGGIYKYEAKRVPSTYLKR